MIINSPMVIVFAQFETIVSFLGVFYCYPGKQLLLGSTKVPLNIPTAFLSCNNYNNYVLEQKNKNQNIWKLVLLYSWAWNMVKDVSPFFKANSSLVRNIFRFPVVSVFNTSATPLITICRYSNLIFVHVCYVVTIYMRCFLNCWTL